MPFAGFGDAVTVRPSPLPVELGPGPFSTAGARLLGVPPERLSRSDLVHPTRGAHMLVEPETLVERALAFQVAMPGNRAFSHVTAALLWGLPLPRALEQLATAEGAPLHVMAPTRDGMVHRAGVVGHRGLEVRAVAGPPGEGLRVVDLADTWTRSPVTHGVQGAPDVRGGRFPRAGGQRARDGLRGGVAGGG